MSFSPTAVLLCRSSPKSEPASVSERPFSKKTEPNRASRPRPMSKHASLKVEFQPSLSDFCVEIISGEEARRLGLLDCRGFRSKTTHPTTQS